MESNFKIACDVNNPLCGKNTATFIFAKQKSLEENQLQYIDPKIQNFAGTGAAGGLGFALITFLNAELIFGADLILDFIKFNYLINNVDVVIVGGEKMDYQSLCGKISVVVAQRAKKTICWNNW